MDTKNGETFQTHRSGKALATLLLEETKGDALQALGLLTLLRKDWLVEIQEEETHDDR